MEKALAIRVGLQKHRSVAKESRAAEPMCLSVQTV